jgi:hypothetical protein
MTEELMWLDFFHGGVPAYQLFRLSLDDLEKLAAMSDDKEGGTSTKAEICFIGLAAYFEAFCKNQFAAILNVCPESLSTFSDKRQDATVPLRILPAFIRKMDYRIGSLIAEQYDFGSAKALNGLFRDLLGCTPFSKKEATEYGRFLNDRNLLVHHGGIYTQKYHGQTFRKRNLPRASEVYYHSLVITIRDFQKWCDWANRMARKIAEISRDGLLGFTKTHSVRLSTERQKALESFTWFD